MTEFNEEIVLLAHGGGGSLSRQLLEKVILPPLRNPLLDTLDDGACLSVPESTLVLTTDSYVVDPLFFPGGNIGVLAACGTVNDLAMQGARPLAMTCGLIIEEGLRFGVLRDIVQSLADSLAAVGAHIVSGDTKVVQRGKGSGLYINTTGIGIQTPGLKTGIANAVPGDAVILTGTLADHGIAVMNERENLGLQADIVSDVAPLWPMIDAVLQTGAAVHCMRDPTRGGLTTALCDMAEASGVGVAIRETDIPVNPTVRAACDLLGLDPLNVANEGKAVIVCPPDDETKVLKAMHAHPFGANAASIGTVSADHPGMVVLHTPIGGTRVLTPPAGFDLPRIC
jgi:hydrogenase expression/formation protein HypE